MRTEICEYLEWDSQFFGHRIARLTEDRLTRDRAIVALEWCQTNHIDCLYFLAASNHSCTVALAEFYHFHFVDVRLTFDRPLSPEAGDVPDVRVFQPSDGPRLRAIAAVSHRDSRFYYDQELPHSRCDALYATWIERSFSGWADAVLVAAANDKPAGYVTCHLSPSGVGSIGLLGVDPECQGRGLGRQLVDASLQYFHRNGMKQVTVVTQGRNVASQRLYQQCGFRTLAVQLWYHLWLRRESLP